VEPVTEDVAQQLRLPDARGVLVSGIYSRGPAGSCRGRERDGHRLSVNGTPIDSPGQLRILAGDMAPGSPIKLRVWQDGQQRDFEVQAGSRPNRVQGV
jgi:S1-C subfamily serine protease